MSEFVNARAAQEWREERDKLERAKRGLRLAVPNTPPPPREEDYGAQPEGAERGEATSDEPLPKLVLLKRVKGRVREWNVRDWIPKRTPTLLQGDGGLGKSTLLQQWQSSCATNTLWLGLTADSGEAARL
jgi:AAA domain